MNISKTSIIVSALALSSLSGFSQFTGTNPVWTNSNVGIGYASSPSLTEKLVVNGNILLAPNKKVLTNNGGALTIEAGQAAGESYTVAGHLYLKGGIGGSYEYIFGGEANYGNTTGGNVYINGGQTNDNGILGNQYMGNVLISDIGGNVGIGTASPVAKLHVVGSSYFQGTLGVGTTCIPAGHVMAVKGKIMCEELNIKLSNGAGCWPDYVFSADYKLPSIDEVATYIKANQHLPEVPSAATVENEGLTVGEMQMVQMKKIEELTLYIIQLKNELEEVKAKQAQK